MNFDQLSWKMDEDVMRFTAPRGTAIGDAYFESVNYFNYNKKEVAKFTLMFMLFLSCFMLVAWVVRNRQEFRCLML